MIPNLSVPLETGLSRDAIYQEMKKIFHDPLFKNSEILKKFLLFIVDQTLLGNSNSLKEYTIGVQILSKSTDFKPQENGIVRIHAGRLRRALNHYYDNDGANDAIHIEIPKGCYVPVFNEKQMPGLKYNSKETKEKPITVAVIPFSKGYNDQLQNVMGEGLCWQITTKAMTVPNFFVIAYSTVRALFEKDTDIITIASMVGAEYVITGYVQSVENHGRIYVQLIDMNTNQQVWSKMYEREFNADNMFKLQDKIGKIVIAEIKGLIQLMTPKLPGTSLMTIA